MTHKLSPIVAGPIEAEIIRLDAPISFWGGVDNLTGCIIDQSHPQLGCSLSDRCVVIPAIRGSGGTPGSLAFLIKQGLGPAGIILGKPDVNVMVGVVVATKLYDIACPIFTATPNQFSAFETGQSVIVTADGLATFIGSPPKRTKT